VTDARPAAGGRGPSAPQELREVGCLFCGTAEQELRFRDGAFRVVRCRNCGLTYVTPRLPPERLHEMYQEEYWSSDRARDFGYTRYLADAPDYLRTYRLRSRLITSRRAAPGRVLDVGCAAGFFLKVMADLGWKTTGLEISATMCEYGRTTLGLPDVRRGDLLSVPLEPQSFDVITLWDVIEHLEDPPAHLRAARAALADDGLLVLETQNVASTFARLLGRRWQHFKHEEHLYHFEPATLARLLSDAGFRILHRTARYGGKYVSPHFVAERVGKIHPIFAALSSPLRVIPGPSVYVNLRDEMVVLAAKDQGAR
jgi:2-polyprenyl-3-methyl-5-hydroxy-6-metoxy-1,4-benzoquinol methylase